MKYNKKMKAAVFLIIGIFFILSVVNKSNNNFNLKAGNRNNFNLDIKKLKISEISEKIHINNNWSETKTAGICIGSGTASDPYIIENLKIDGKGSGSCILIENSDVFFKIENCYLNNTGDEYYDAGIKLIDVDNGQLLNNNATGDAFGFYLNRSDNNLITGNRLTGKRGLYIGICYGTIMYLNNLKGNQLDLFILIKDESAYRFYSPKKATYIYKSNTFTRYLGNYWSGLNRNFDNNDDGIGDDPQIYYDSYDLLIDKYPLVEPFENYEIIKFSEDSGEIIPGYNLTFLFGVLSITLICILFKLKNHIKKSSNKFCT